MAEPHVITLTTNPCPLCGNVATIDVLRSDWKRYRDGALIQVAFPEMPPADRELLMSGCCTGCFDIIAAAF